MKSISSLQRRCIYNLSTTNHMQKPQYPDNNQIKIALHTLDQVTYQEKILAIIKFIKSQPLSIYNKSLLIQHIDIISIKNNSILPNNRAITYKVLAWCAMFHAVKGYTPQSLNELNIFFNNNNLYFAQDSNNIEMLIYKYAKEDNINIANEKLYNLIQIRQAALATPTYITNLSYKKDISEINFAACQIQQVYKLRKLWRKFVTNPTDEYREYSDDRLANTMFGKHIAAISWEVNYNEFCELITQYGSIKNEFYHRTYTTTETDNFHTMNITNTNFTNIPAEKLGNCRTLWQDSIKAVSNNRMLKAKTATNNLKSYKISAYDLIKSTPFKKLMLISLANKHLNLSLHADELYRMIILVCRHPIFTTLSQLANETKIRIENNLARLHLFLIILVTLYNNNHLKFGAMLEPVVHEISLLVYEITSISKKPLISYKDFNAAVQREFNQANNIANNQHANETKQIIIYAYTANSGMHAYILSLMISKLLLDIKPGNKDQFFYHQEDDYYFEMEGIAGQILEIKPKHHADIYIINGSVIDAYKPYTRGFEINYVVSYLLQNKMLINGKHYVIILDTTNAENNNLKLNDQTQHLINNGGLSIIIWESWQKMGILGTDQIQFGRVVVLSNQSNAQKLQRINDAAAKDIIKLDMQIGALFQTCRIQYNKYKDFNFINGKILRNETIGEYNRKTGPFLYSKDIINVLQLFHTFPILARASFGFNTISVTPDEYMRISAGSEQSIDIKIIAHGLKILIDSSKNASTLDINKNPQILQQLIRKLNTYFFSKSYVKVAELTKPNIIELMTYLLVELTVINLIKYTNSNHWYKSIETSNVLKICEKFLRLSGIEYKTLINTQLEGSKKSISIIVNLKLAIRSQLLS